MLAAALISVAVTAWPARLTNRAAVQPDTDNGTE
jgi:hypothetical protein